MGERGALRQPATLSLVSTTHSVSPQTTGEIRTRAARMFEFIDLKHVEVTLDALATLATPLVIQMPRQPGQKEVRYAHLMGGEPQMPVVEADTRARAPAPAPAADDRVTALEQSVASLRAELGQLRDAFEEFRRQF